MTSSQYCQFIIHVSLLLVLQVYLKTHFNYDPKKDNLIPCRDAGLPFREGEILQVVNMDDMNWWQVNKTQTSFQCCPLHDNNDDFQN